MDKLLTAEQVAERWQVAVENVWARVDGAEDPLPFVPLGRGTPRRGSSGQRGNLRFRLSSLEAWEARAERSFKQETRTDDVKAAAALVGIAGHDGTPTIGRRGKAGPRRKVVS